MQQSSRPPSDDENLAAVRALDTAAIGAQVLELACEFVAGIKKVAAAYDGVDKPLAARFADINTLDAMSDRLRALIAVYKERTGVELMAGHSLDVYDPDNWPDDGSGEIALLPSKDEAAA